MADEDDVGEVLALHQPDEVVDVVLEADLVLGGLVGAVAEAGEGHRPHVVAGVEERGHDPLPRETTEPGPRNEHVRRHGGDLSEARRQAVPCPTRWGTAQRPRAGVATG